MAVTMQELAEAAGVSRGTIDRVLHNRGKVRPEVEARVREVAEQLGYLPNRAGKALAISKKAIKLGCFLPSIGNPFYDDVKRGVRRAEKALADYSVTVVTEECRGFKAKTHLDCIKALVDAGCDGICVSTIDAPSIQNYINKIIEDGIPVVTVNTDMSNTNRLCYVGGDYIECGRIAGGLLSLCACCEPDILVATGSYKVKGHNERVSGFKAALDERKRTYRISNIYETQDDNETAYKKTQAALKRNPGVNCIYIAAAGVSGVCRAAIEAGFKEKQNSIIISFDDVEETRKLVEEGVINFTISQNPERQGYHAVRKLFDYFLVKSPQKDFYTELVVKIKENILR